MAQLSAPEGRRKVKMIFDNNEEYEGETLNYWRDGQGVFKYQDGSKYEGGWKENRRHGSGKHSFPNGDEYSGDWADGERSGTGIFQCAENDTRYQGTWLAGRKHGHGELLFPNGTKLSGNWENDQPPSCGQLHFADNTVYDGAITCRDSYVVRHGRGNWKKKEITYECEWVNDVPDGDITCKWDNLSTVVSARGASVTDKSAKISDDNGVYEGRVDAVGNKHGWGKLSNSDGKVYEGYWVADDMFSSIEHQSNEVYLPDKDGGHHCLKL